MSRAGILPTDDDLEIRLGLACNRNAQSWLATLRADERDAAVIHRLARTRRNNKRARAFCEQPEQVPA